MGYVADNAQSDNNLIDKFANWSDIRTEISSGQGGELRKGKNELRKFNAVHSSAALCVNNFVPIKLSPRDFGFQGCKSFLSACFEKKLPTGISTPNIDFFLETRDEILAIESKYTEVLDRKKANHDRNLEKYRNRRQLRYLPEEFGKIIDEYISDDRKFHLDVAQLLKHAMGLIRTESAGKIPTLLYLYWLPENWREIDEYKNHNEEVAIFGKRINAIIRFVGMPYTEFWDMYVNDTKFGDHFKRIKRRYSLKLKIEKNT